MSGYSETSNPFKILITMFENAGIDIDMLFKTANLSQTAAEDDSWSTNLATQWPALLQAAVELSGEAGLPIRLGQSIDLANYGTYGFAIMSCLDLRAALGLQLRYRKMVDPSSDWRMVEHGNGLMLRLHLNTGTAYQQQLLTELLFSNIYTAGQFLSATTSKGTELQLSYAKPAHFSSYKKHLPIPILFDQEYSQMFIPEAGLQQPIRTANPAINVLFTQQCEEMLSSLTKVESTSAAIRLMLIQSASALLNISQVAERLHLTERTLRRRLTAEATTFSTICDDVRNLLAQKYLSNTSLSVTEIAYLLSYTEPVNFRRAFSRWNGMTPSAYRMLAD